MLYGYPDTTAKTSSKQIKPATVLVVGATGRTGQLIVSQLISQDYQVRIFVRNPVKANQLFNGTVEVVTGDVRDKDHVTKAINGIHKIISVIGTAGSNDPGNRPEFVDYGGAKNLVSAAASENVEHFVMVSSRSAGQQKHILNERHHNVLMWKLKAENVLRDSKIPYTIIRPGGLQDKQGGQHGILAFAPQQGDTKLKMIPREDVAATCVAALNSNKAIGKTLAIVSDPSAPIHQWDQLFMDIPADQAEL